MLRLVLALFATLAPLARAQNSNSAKSSDYSELKTALSFEAQPAGDMPGGWGGGPPGTIFADDKIFHGGRRSARLERQPGSPDNFSTITKSIPMDFSGSTVELRGFLRTVDVSGFVGLWMREDGESPALAFDNMQARQLKGTTVWTEYSITLPLDPDARQLFFGVLVVGTGKAWADELQLLVDGKPVWDAPRFERPKTALDLDHEFDGGSRVSISDLTKIQIENLVTLGKVWGFLKYHHPKITAGERHWDYDLFRVLPKVVASPDHASANHVFAQWIASLGDIPPCHPCATLDNKDIYSRPDLDWIANPKLLGEDLSRTLLSIRDNRAPDKQFYVSKDKDVGNPKFEHELGYPTLKLPDAGYQLLALYRFWNIIEYWSPYRDLVAADWTRVLTEFVPRIAEAKTADAYRLEMLALIAKARDGHANLWSALDERPPLGKCQLAASIQFIENAPVIVGLLHAAAGDVPGELQVGDAITEIDGVPINQLIEKWKPYYAASNDAARMRDIVRSMTRGECGESSIRVSRRNHDLALKATRVPSTSDPAAFTHDLPGPTFRLLSKDVAYLKLSSVKAEDAASYVNQAAGTKGLIIDIRNYPSSFMVFALGSLLVDRETPFATFTQGDLSNPGAFHWVETESLKPAQPHYAGKVVILVDETSMSQSEYTAMAFRSARGATVVGSTTSGADGNVSPFALPADLRTMISGIGVFYPDKTPTQKLGIVPDIKVAPTIAGTLAGRDEVLEQALRQILARQVPEAEIERLARH